MMVRKIVIISQDLNGTGVLKNQAESFVSTLKKIN